MLNIEDKVVQLKNGNQPSPKNGDFPIDRCIVEANRGPTRGGRWWNHVRRWFHLYSNRERTTWSPSWGYFGPLSGLFSLCVVAGSLVAAIAVLLGSNNSNVDAWPTPPSTFVAIFTAIGNLGVRYALAQGVLVTWWLKACNGSTLSRLQMDWRAGTSIRGAISAGASMGMIGIACLFSGIILVDGPLLQRASTVATIQMPINQTLQVLMAPELPHGWSGVWGTVQGVHPNPAFNSTVPTSSGSIKNDIVSEGLHAHAQTLWEATDPLPRVVAGCRGECRATILAPALFSTSCKTRNVDVNPDIPYHFAAVYDTTIAAPLGVEVFIITNNLLVRNRSTEAIDLITGYSSLDQGNCKGNLTYSICTLEAGIGEYDILVQNDQVNMEMVQNPRFIALANNTGINNGVADNSTLAAVVNYMRFKWESFIAIYKNPHNGVISKFGDNGVVNFVENGRLGNAAFGGGGLGKDVICASYRDPYHDMIKEMNRLMMYLGAAAAKEDPEYLSTHMDPGLSVHAEVVGQTTEPTSIYRTRWWPIIVAAAVDAACIALIAPLYWNWWKLGRALSFSPLEIAKAFMSPLLSECHSNSSANELGEATRQIAVQYGLRHSDFGSDDGTTVAFGDPGVTRRPEGTVPISA